MQIFRYEWKKVTRKKLFWAISILLFFLNGVLFFYNQYYTEEYRAFGVFRQEYEKFQKKIEKIQPKEREEVLLEWQNIYSMAGSISANKALRADFTEEDEKIFQMQLEQYQREQPEVYEQAVEIAKQEDFDVWEKYITDYLEQIQYQTEYKDYIANMKKRTKNQLSNPVFKKGSYAYYNLLKSCIDFEKCKNINTEIGEHCGVEAATGFTLTDFFVFGILFLLGIYLYMQEKENGLLCLVRSNVKGRYKVAWAKCLIVFIINMLICLLFYGADLFLSYQLYGFGDTSRMVQSIPAFRNCSLLITIALIRETHIPT